MKTINGIILTNDKVKRISDGKIFTCIIPSPKWGYYKSLMHLNSHGYDPTNLIEKKLVDLNPHKFKHLKQ